MHFVSLVASAAACLFGVLLILIWPELAYDEFHSGNTAYVRGYHANASAHIDVEGTNVQARWSDQGDWQRLTLEKDDAGRVLSGDVIYLKAHTGQHLCVEGEHVQAGGCNLRHQQKFMIEGQDSQEIVPGSVFTLKAHTGKYIGIDGINVHATSAIGQKLVLEKVPKLTTRTAKLWRKVIAVVKVIVLRTYEHFTRPRAWVSDMPAYQKRVQQTITDFKAMAGTTISLADGVHRNVWMGSSQVTGAKLDLSQYVHILDVNKQAQTVDVEGRAYYTDVLKYLLDEHNMTLEVIPDMVHLTLGGLYAGVGGGAASFKFGALHHSVLEVDVLTASGEVLTCSPMQNADLFALLPGSLGTFGYILRMRVRAIPAKRYVVAKHIKFDSFHAFESAMSERMSDASLDFLDGVIYEPNDCVLIEGVMSDTKPDVEDLYSLQSTGVPYAKLATQGGEHWFTLLDFIYKWDPDGYFSTLEGPDWVRNTVTRKLLAKAFPWFHRSDWLRELFSIVWEFDLKQEGSNMYVDYVVPLNGHARHLEWFDEHVGLYPLYMAPIGLKAKPLAEYALTQFVIPSIDVGVGYGNMGKYGSNKHRVIETRKLMESYFGHVEGGTRLQSTKINLGDTDAFWAMFPAGARDKYFAAKSTFDPNNAFPSIVDKLR